MEICGKNNDTIAAVATGTGGAIDLIRISGPDAVGILGRIFVPVSGRDISEAGGYTLHYGTIRDGSETIDDVIVSVFRSPHSYTGEEMAEINCHGSTYIRQRIMTLLTDAGARPAGAGEFTMRAFLAGKMDLSQAEAVADLIASEDRASHAVAINQMRGGFSQELKMLRESLVEIASLLELELDFSEEEVEFADRERLGRLTGRITDKIIELTESFAENNLLKEGIPVVIAGEPNTGKSTLLNALLGEDRAMVSDIPGTTRDSIDGTLVIGGVKFRFTDTAGLRHTEDRLENMGIERARSSILRSRVVLYVVAPAATGGYDLEDISGKIASLDYSKGTTLRLILNKCDISDGVMPDTAEVTTAVNGNPLMVRGGKKIECSFIVSAKNGKGLDNVKSALAASIDSGAIYNGGTVVTNIRHYEALEKSRKALVRVKEGLDSGATADFLAGDVRDALYHIGTVTGEVTTDEILGSIFSKFCIGK